MKTTKKMLLAIGICFFVFFSVLTSVFAQIVVPKGWENRDSLRFGLFDIHDKSAYSPNLGQADSLADLLDCTFEESFGTIDPSEPFRGKRKGYMAWGGSFSDLGLRIKQRVYYPSPSPLTFTFDPGYYWRYIDTNGYSWHINSYDSNAINPYAEFLQNTSIDTQTFVTNGSTVRFGNVGRVILGYSDNRFANQMLLSCDNYPFGSRSGKSDTARMFSVTLEFNIDTEQVSSIDTILSGKSKDDVPLLRLQVLFKAGKVTGSPSHGMAVLSFVPFKTPSDSSKAGWFKVVDTVITKKIYRSLNDSWRVPDTLESGIVSHSWHFKQLHVLLDSMPESMKKLVRAIPSFDSLGWLKDKEGQGSGAARILGIQHPDSLVNTDTSDPNLQDKHLLEMRVLSTYRATVRIRSLTFQDTIVDKYLYRRMFGDTVVHSCNNNGSYGGLDDSVKAEKLKWKVALGNRKPREFLINDTPPDFSPLACSMIGFLDYIVSKDTISMHIREQEYGNSSDWSSHYRRSRISHDGMPPGMFENQVGIFNSDWGTDAYIYDPHLDSLVNDVFPSDYLLNGISLNLPFHWPFDNKDSLVGLIIGRQDLSGGGHDTLTAYKRYTDLRGGIGGFIGALRNSVSLAYNHPKNKRFAIESNIQGWGIIGIQPDGTFSYAQRPTTPEETQAMLYAALANGVTAFGQAQTFDAGIGKSGGAPGCFGISSRTNESQPFKFVHNYNFGHRYSRWDSTNWSSPTNSECDILFPKYYLGYSNTYLSFMRAIDRINQIYDTTHGRGSIPFKRFTWLNAYSTHKAISVSGLPALFASDSATKSNAFLKCFCTTPVKRWSRGSYNEYIDSLIADSSYRTYVEIGLFKDSINVVTKNCAALIVNTRLWPSLRDAEDSIYYNKGLDSAKDRSRSTLGDIDTRKVWFKIDTSMMDTSFRTNYYVVRDLWHPDSTWLVKNDSSFAIYLKPGDAKFLYIEKGVAIRMAKTAATEEVEYAFNNGRRIAEIMGGTRTVGTYVRGGKLYVSYPRKGETIEGYAERSAGDNIATGHEVLLDSNLTNRRPSIIAGMNDTSVGIVYWNSGSSGRIKAAFQKHPDSAWMFTSYLPKAFADTSSDGSEVTPVITPYADIVNSSDNYTSGRDSIWWIAAGYEGTTGNPLDPQGIAALRLRIFRDSIRFITDTPMQYFYKNLTTSPNRDASKFPTITSRPIPGFKFPARLAWQNFGKILYNRFKDMTGTVTADLATPFIVSDGLPSFCYNRHPSIAMHTMKYNEPVPIIGGTVTIQSTGPDQRFKLYDEVVWEAKLLGNLRWNTNNNYWPVLRQHIEYLQFNKNIFWSNFRVFKPVIDSPYYHYPIVSAGSRSDLNDAVRKRLWNNPLYYDDIRVAWQDKPANLLDFAHWIRLWRRTTLLEAGSYPSLPQSTFADSMLSFKTMTDSSSVPASIGFVGIQTDNGKNQVRVTNGWIPKISNVMSTFLYPTITIATNVGALVDCLPIKGKNDYGSIVQYHGGGIYKTIDWLSFSQAVDPIPISIPFDTLVADSINHIAFFSDTSILVANDSIVIARRIDTLDLISLRAALADSSDYFMIRTTLRKYLDSSYVATIDSSVITKSVAIYPGNGLDSNFVKYHYPSGSPTDTVFILVEVWRKNLTDSVSWAASEYLVKDAIPVSSFKTSASPEPRTELKMQYLNVDVIPNPFSQSTTVKIRSTEGLLTHVEVFDMLGRKIVDLFNGDFPSVPLEMKFEPAILSAGAYFIRVQSGSEIVTRKIQLVK